MHYHGQTIFYTKSIKNRESFKKKKKGVRDALGGEKREKKTFNPKSFEGFTKINSVTNGAELPNYPRRN